ncbi:MAG: peptide chain release factor N(5)-glutamine methyltransferase [Acidobacteria bacterium]|nr:peptide chain release factor N(5)-glutamine methyltransferase [Acidobacteriota bacterium]
MQLKEALAQGIDLLEKACVPSPRITAEVLLMHAARCDRAHLYAHPERELTDSEWVHYGRYLDERLGGKPTQYITGHQEFWGMDFLVNPAVLIPRPETELVVEASLVLARRHFSSGGSCNIADVGTGSGCIAVALASELPQARIYALDQSAEALETARKNAERQGVEARITFLFSDLLQASQSEPRASASGSQTVGNSAEVSHPLPSGRGSDFVLPPLEMVVSNPPYVAESDRNKVAPEVRDFEPHAAVFAGESGREVYSKLVPQAGQALRSGGYLVLELGYDSQDWVRGLLEPPQWDEIQWLPDLAGIVRVVTARRVPASVKQWG